VTRGIEAVAGSFELEVSDRWANQAKPWPIFEEDECSLEINGVPVITGHVDHRNPAYGPAEHRLAVAGRDRTGALVDCSADLKTWEFRGVPLLTLARRLAEPFGIPVTVQPGLAISQPVAKLTVDPGDSCFDAIELACRMVGVLPVSDGAGGLRLTRAGETRCVTELVQGENILAASADYDASGRFARYVVTGQHAGSDDLFGELAARVKAEARDENVRRRDRVLLVRPGSNATQGNAKQRAAWEATVRAARSRRVRVAIRGWQQSDGKLWPVNALVRLRSPFLGIDDDLLIAEATYSLTESGGTTTELSLVPASAFEPEPVVPKRKEAGYSFAPAPAGSSDGP
jgi:prophage tail gpP-like protein